MGRPRFAFLSILACCLMLAHAAVAGINFVPGGLLPAARQPQFMLSGDLDRDGLADVVVIAPQSNEVDVYLGRNASPYFVSSQTLIVQPPKGQSKLGGGAIGDLNNDGFPDLAIVDSGNDMVWILIGQHDGTFGEPYEIPVAHSKRPSAVAIGNFANSAAAGHGDLAVADDRANMVFILRSDNQTKPSYLEVLPIPVGSQPEDIRAVDLDGNGSLDLAVLSLGGPQGKELDTILFDPPNQGVPIHEPPQKWILGANPSSLVVADFDHNGLPDFAMINHPVGTPSGIRIDEIDVLLSANDSPKGTLSLGPLKVIPVPCPFPTGGPVCKAQALAAGDFDGNGTVDLVVALSDPRPLSFTDAMQAFGGRGDGSFASGGVFTIQKEALSMVAADFTGDDAPDLAVATLRTLNLQAFDNVSTPGSIANGDSCLQDADCLASRCTDGVCCADQCDAANGEKCNVPGREGTCVPTGHTPVTCTLPNPICASGTFCVDGFCCDQPCQGGRCDRDGYQGVCIPSTPNGGACSTDTECASGFCTNLVCCNSACAEGFCDDLGICHALSANGTPCQQGSECQSGICDSIEAICCNAMCDQSTQICFHDQGICRPLNYTPGPGTPGYVTPEPTPTATPRSTPASVGTSCSISGDCQNHQCVDGVCCQTSSCPAGDQCQQGTGMCVVVTPTPTSTVRPTDTISPTALPTTPTPDPCGDPHACQSGYTCSVSNGLAVCSKTSSGGGCSTAGDDPARGNLAVAALLPLALWAGRRWQLRRVRVRSRALRQ